jgi:hypothetical protein
MAPVTTATDDIIVAIDASISQFISGVTVHGDEQNNYARLVACTAVPFQQSSKAAWQGAPKLNRFARNRMMKPERA